MTTRCAQRVEIGAVKQKRAAQLQPADTAVDDNAFDFYTTERNGTGDLSGLFAALPLRQMELAPAA